MFYDIFNGLCETNGVSKTKAAREIGLSNATPTKWKKTGATPDGTTIALVAKYFGVEPNFLMGFTPEGHLLETQYQLARLEEEYERETDPEKKNEIGYGIDLLRESYEDQKLVVNLSKGIKKEPGTQSTRLNSEQQELIDLIPGMTQQEVCTLLTFAKAQVANRKDRDKQ